MKKSKKASFVATAAMIAALYVVLTYLTNMLGLASGPVQCRLSEALCVLSAFTPAAIPGLFAGCAISNFVTGCHVIDIVFGSVATLIGAGGTYLLRNSKSFLYVLPPIAANTVIVPFVLKYTYGFEGGLLYFVVTVFLGELISCGALGTILATGLKKYKNILFK